MFSRKDLPVGHFDGARDAYRRGRGRAWRSNGHPQQPSASEPNHGIRKPRFHFKTDARIFQSPEWTQKADKWDARGFPHIEVSLRKDLPVGTY
jgi:hypothetical protein